MNSAKSKIIEILKGFVVDRSLGVKLGLVEYMKLREYF
jgi:hypothetical protein